MAQAQFRIGERVLDEWEQCYFDASVYKKYSVGTILDVVEQHVTRNRLVKDIVTKKYVKEFVTTHEIKYRIRWTSGPKAGKITYMKNLYSYQEKIEKRRGILNTWCQAFDDFFSTSSKESR